MPKVIVLGNCLAERLALLLEPILAQRNKGQKLECQWQLVKVPPVYNLPFSTFTRENVAELAKQCDVVFTRPLFNFGALNTAELQKRHLRLHTFSAPNFEAYFPDIIHPGKFEEEKFPPPLEWHSLIFLEFKASNKSLANLEAFYFSHPVFHAKNIATLLEKSWSVYKQREQNVEIGTFNIVRDFHASEILFYTWKHPADRIIRHLLSGILARLNFSRNEVESALNRIPFQERAGNLDIWSYWGFGFNAWPVINRSHLYTFPGREFFRIQGQHLNILQAGIRWFEYYDQHPHVFNQLLRQVFA